jgi:hypothetical protein
MPLHSLYRKYTPVLVLVKYMLVGILKSVCLNENVAAVQFLFVLRSIYILCAVKETQAKKPCLRKLLVARLH